MYNVSPDRKIGGFILFFYVGVLQFMEYYAMINLLSYLNLSDGGNI